MQEWVQHDAIKLAIGGLTAAVAIDIVEFRKFKSWDDAARYDWGVASWRWFQGFVTGLLSGFGLNQIGVV